jgi:nucleotide-binding universal stress UspA family protein
MFKKILLGYAGGRAGLDAAVLAGQLARMADGELSVAFPFHPLFTTVSAETVEDRLRAELATHLDDSDLFADARYHWSNSSWPIRALHDLADYEHSDVIVFCAAPERPEPFQISLMERMVHGAPCAVALAPQGFAERKRRSQMHVGVGFADTREGHEALVLAREIAAGAGSPLRVIACAEVSPSLLAYASGSPLLAQAEEKLFAEAQLGAERAIAELSAQDGTELQVLRGDACRLLIDAADELDLLILGSRAYGPLRHALLGGVSAGVMRDAHCPVLVAPRGASVRPTRIEATADAGAGR